MTPDEREHDETARTERTGAEGGPTADQLSQGAENAGPEHDDASGMFGRESNKLRPETGGTPPDEDPEGPDPADNQDPQIDR